MSKMNSVRRRAGEPVSKALRAKIVAALRKDKGVAPVSRETGVTWQIIDKIRQEEGIAKRPTGVNNTKIDPSKEAAILARLRDPYRLGDASIAQEFDVGRGVVKRIRIAAKIDGLPKGGAWDKLDASDNTRERIARDDEISRLRRELKEAHRATLDDVAIKILLGRMSAETVEPPSWTTETPKHEKDGTPEVPVTIWSDWHVGEVISRNETAGVNEFNLEIAEQRIKRLVTSTISLCRDFHKPAIYPGIVVNQLGDMVSGGIHPDLLKTDAEESIPAALRCRDMLVWAFDKLLIEFGRVYVPCTSGNHGRTTIKPEMKRYVHQNFDWLIAQLLARHYEGRKEIVFDIPESNEVHYRVYGQRYLAMHGDTLGVKGGDGIIGSLGPIARGEVKVGKQAAAIGRDYDVLLMGHWHQMLWLPRVIVNGALKGFDEYAKNKLRAVPAEPTQALWFVHPDRGITSRWEVRVDEEYKAASEPWVSWQGH